MMRGGGRRNLKPEMPSRYRCEARLHGLGFSSILGNIHALIKKCRMARQTFKAAVPGSSPPFRTV